MAPFLPILTFHDIDERPSVISVSPGVFQRGLAGLHHHGYRAMGLTAAADMLTRGGEFPDRCFAITFDDGYRSVYTAAFPVLQRYGMSATVFLSVGGKGSIGPEGRLPSLDGRSMLSWGKIREMKQFGIEIGAHTCTHPDLTRLPVNQAGIEIHKSKAIIEDALGAAVHCFAYPYGRYNRQIRAIVKQHFVCACSDKLGLIRRDSDPYALERVDAYYLRTDRLFRIMLSGLFPLYVAARSIPRRIQRFLQP